MKEIAIPGLEGSGLLGFVAGLGVLEALWTTRLPDQPEPRLGWRQIGTWQPIVTGVSSLEEVAVRILDDKGSDVVKRVLDFRYLKLEKNGSKEVRSLAAPVAVLRAAMASNVSSGNWRAADTLASLMCESAVEPMDDTKVPSSDDMIRSGIDYDRRASLDHGVTRTPFDFTSRNTQFLDQLRRIGDVLTTEVIVNDLSLGLGSLSERIMRWDSLVDMPGALFDRIAPMSRPAAEWLVFRGIALFTLVAVAGSVRMPGFSGRRKAGEFSWVLWSDLLTHDVVKTALSLRWALMDRSERIARGAIAGFKVNLRKDATGYDGAVSPSRPLEGGRPRLHRAPTIGSPRR